MKKQPSHQLHVAITPLDKRLKKEKVKKKKTPLLSLSITDFCLITRMKPLVLLNVIGDFLIDKTNRLLSLSLPGVIENVALFDYLHLINTICHFV